MQGTRFVRQSRFNWLLSLSVGLVLSVAFYAVLSVPALRNSVAYRYFCGHPIKLLTTWLFFWALAVLGAKLWQLRRERAALGRQLLPQTAQRPLPVSEAQRLIDALAQLPARLRGTWLARRLHDALAHVQLRRSANDVDERLRMLADRDAEELDGSYELVRTITWAIPILGFLGTVVGITIAVANITPEQLQESLSEVVGGLAVAFDTTALALALSIVLVLARFAVERAERAALAQVDTASEAVLVQLFDRIDAQGSLLLGLVEAVANVILRSTRDAWREQGQLWCRKMAEVGQRQAEAIGLAGTDVVEALQQAAERMVAQAAGRARAWEQRQARWELACQAAADQFRQAATEQVEAVRAVVQQLCSELQQDFDRFTDSLQVAQRAWHESLTDAAQQLTSAQSLQAQQTELLHQLVSDGGRLAKLQQTLDQNLAALANAQTLDQAVHSLAAVAHLLSARTGRTVPLPAVGPGEMTEAAA